MPFLYVLIGFFAGVVQVVLLPSPWSWVANPLCMGSVMLLGVLSLVFQAKFEDGKITQKTRILIFCLFWGALVSRQYSLRSNNHGRTSTALRSRTRQRR